MSAKIFINNLDTFVSRQILAVLRGDDEIKNDDDAGDEGEKPQFYGTYFDKDSSVKPTGIVKMLKVSWI